MSFIMRAMDDSSSLELVAGRLKFPPGGRELCTGWDDAMRSDRAEALRFLTTAYITEAAQEVGLTGEMITALAENAERIRKDEDLLAFFRYCHHRMLNDPEFTNEWIDPWPRLDDYLGPDAGLINVLAVLSTVPQMREDYRRMGIPADVARDTVTDVKRWMETDEYFQRHGRWGITPWIVRWHRRHQTGKIFQIKRLHFSRNRFDGRLKAYRRRGGREVVALSTPGVRYLAYGNLMGRCCGDATGTWESAVEETADAVIGNPIRPTGLVRRETIRIPLAEWDLVLSPGDPILGIHIPTGSPMTFDDCGESFRRALDFYPRYFPEFKSRGFSTSSWLLDPRLEAILSPDSNIVRTMREFYLYPGTASGNHGFFERVFGWGINDIKGLPRKTSLQRAVGDYTDQGGHFHGGSCFLLNEDLDWGSQVYRQMEPKLVPWPRP
jgi:hypothetical protein